MRNRVVSCLLVVVLLVLVACVAEGSDDLDAGDGGPRSEASAPPPPAAGAPMTLWLSASSVPPGPAELVAVLVNHSGVEATFGVPATVDRWEGGTWVAHSQLVMCLDHWHCTASMEPAGAGLDSPSIGLSATFDQVGPVERFSTEGLDLGWYRISQEANEGIVASAVIEVAEGAPTPAPLVPVDSPAVSVRPVVVPPAGAAVELYPLVPAPSGSQSVTDVELAVKGLSEVAAVERWAGGTWEPAGEAPLVPPVTDPPGFERSTTLPPLDPGAYRLVRTGPEGDHAGHFWVASFDAPAAAGPAFEVLETREATEPMGSVRAAVDANGLALLWSEVGFGAAPPAVNFASWVVVSVTIPDDACPPEVTGVFRDGAELRLGFEEVAEVCDEPLIPKTFVVAVDRASVAPEFTLVLPGDDTYGFGEQRLDVDVPGEPAEPGEDAASGPPQVEDVQLTDSGACGDAYFWAATDTGDIAVTLSVDARERAADETTTIPISLPDPAVTVQVLKGANLTRNFCTDLPDRAADPTATHAAVSGEGEVVLEPPSAAVPTTCGGGRGTLRLSGLVAEDGTAFAPVEVTSGSIGCYSG